jgi:hypothetical protein
VEGFTGKFIRNFDEVSLIIKLTLINICFDVKGKKTDIILDLSTEVTCEVDSFYITVGYCLKAYFEGKVWE